MKSLEEELDYFKKKSDKLVSLIPRGVLLRSELIDFYVAEPFYLENTDHLLNFIAIVPNNYLQDVITKMENIKNDGFNWVIGTVGGPGPNRLEFQKFTRDYYDALMLYIQRK
jgi:hypothetical protein